jgi:hypothetical protein
LSKLESIVGHRAALYTVAVHRTGESEMRLLGDIDDSGSSLLAQFSNYITVLEAKTPDGSKSLRYVGSKPEGNKLLATFEYGQRGIEAVIRDSHGQEQYHQQVGDWQTVECGCLFSAAPAQRLGWLVLHEHNGRGTKTLLDDHLREKFRADFPHHALVVRPFVMESVLRKAVQEKQITKVKLVRRVHPTDQADAAVNPWVEAGSAGKIETVITASRGGRAKNLLPEPIRRYLDDEPGARDAIVEFQGQTYDEVKVEVKQEDGRTRTYNIEKPASGHPVTVDLDLSANPSADEVYAALQQALASNRP